MDINFIISDRVMLNCSNLMRKVMIKRTEAVMCFPAGERKSTNLTNKADRKAQAVW